jgi:hypothetical protein
MTRGAELRHEIGRAASELAVPPHCLPVLRPAFARAVLAPAQGKNGVGRERGRGASPG